MQGRHIFAFFYNSIVFINGVEMRTGLVQRYSNTGVGTSETVCMGDGVVASASKLGMLKAEYAYVDSSTTDQIKRENHQFKDYFLTIL